MDVISKVLILVVFVVASVKTAVLPVEKCKLEDSSCMVPAFQKALPIFTSGMPELNVENLDPLLLDDIAFELSGLQFSLKEGSMKGLKSSIIDKVKWDLKKKRFEVEYHLNGSVKGHYTAAGRLLILPISGDGQMRLRLRNLLIHLSIDYKIVKDSDGMDHVAPSKYDFSFDVRDNAHFNLTNLFNGNKQLSDTMLTFLNENWKQVSQEFGRPMVEAAAKKVFKNFVNFFTNVPLQEIAEV